MLKDATILRSNRTGKPPERWETIRLSPLLSPCARLTLITTDVPDETASLEHIHCIIELVNQHGHTHTHTHTRCPGPEHAAGLLLRPKQPSAAALDMGRHGGGVG